MSESFTRYAFTDNVKKAQARYGTRDSYARLEQAGDRYRLTAKETRFIQARDSFYMAMVGENGWPYVQFRGGEKGFLRVIDDTTIGYADFRGNGQYISTGNIEANQKTALILMDYPNQQRLKIWAEATITEAADDPMLREQLEVAGYAGQIERLVVLKVQAFDWNDPNTWQAALDGVTAAHVTYAPDLAIPGATEAIRAFVAKAVELGVRRLVLLSGRGEEEAQLCERIVQDAGVEWIVVRASWFNQNFSEGEFLGMVLDGAIALPAADIPEPFVDVDDIADVAVAALTEDGHNGEIYEVTGPRMLTFTEVAREISRAPINFAEYALRTAGSGVWEMAA